MDEAALCQLLVGSSADGMWLLDETGRTLFANPRMAELLGRSPAQMTGLSVYDTLDDQGKTEFAEHLRQAAAGSPGDGDHPTRHVRADGTPIWLLSSWNPVHDADGSLVGFLHQYSDHTEMRRQIESLEQREQLMRETQTLSRIGSWEWDVVQDRATWSDQLYEIHGLGRHFEPSLDSYLACVLAEDREFVSSAISTIFEGADSFEFTARIVRGDDGRVRWCHALGSAVRDGNGNPVRVVGSSQDVTERVTAEQKVADSTRRLHLLRWAAEAANESTTMVEALRSTGHALAEAGNWKLLAALCREDENDPLVPIDLLEQGMSPEQPPGADLAVRAWESRRIQHRPRPGREQSHSLVAAPVMHRDGVACVVLLEGDEVPVGAVSLDLVAQLATQLGRVAERERAAAELAVARDQAMQASRLKSEFLATMSHEIRTPMNGVIGLTDLLLRAELGGGERKLAQALHGAGLTLRGIIDDILDLSKIEAGKLELEAVDFEIRPVVEQTFGLLQVQAAEKGLHLDVTVDPVVPTFVRGDAGHWAQVLANLGSNAVKFTEAGSVAVDVGVVSGDSERTVVEVVVADTGPGIDSDAQQAIFEPFTQADASTTRSHGGTGLGLAISRRLAEALGGTLSVHSEPGRGSTFRFTAAFTIGGAGERRTEPAEVEARSRSRLQQRVLVVEDDTVNQMVAVGLLEHLGYSAAVAGDGREAVEALTGDHGYAAVLMDCRMPRMDGYAATRAIRAQERPGRRVPIIAMTASALDGERERCLAAGMDDFLTKPVDADRLQRVVDQWVDGAGAEKTAQARPQHASGPPPASDVVDVDRIEMLHQMVKDGQSLFQRSSARFLDSASEHLSAVRGAVDDGDAGRLVETAHRLKGNALNLGLPRVGAAAAALEEQGRTGSLAGTRERCEQLAAEVEAAVAALERERAARG